MKKSIVLFILVLIAANFNSLKAQVKMTKDEFPMYQGVAEVKGQTANFIYSDIEVWITNKFKPYNKTIQVNDPERKRFIVRGTYPFSYTKSIGIGKTEGKCTFIITFDCKDDRFRFTIDVAEVIMDKDNKSMLRELHESSGKNSSRQIIDQVETIKNTLVRSITEIQESSNNAW